MERGRRLFLGELPLRGAARLRGEGGCFWGTSRCAGLLDGGGEEATFGGPPAAQGCSIEGAGGCFWGTSRCAGLMLDGAGEEALSRGAPAARGCSIEGRRRLLLGDLPLRGAARWRGEGGSFLGTSRCAGLLLDGGGEEAAFGGPPAARGCSIEAGGRRLFLGELPLRGAAQLRGAEEYSCCTSMWLIPYFYYSSCLEYRSLVAKGFQIRKNFWGPAAPRPPPIWPPAGLRPAGPPLTGRSGPKSVAEKLQQVSYFAS